MGLTVITPATADPVTVSEVTEEITDYQSDTTNDATMATLIGAATEWVQDQCWRQFMQATYLQTWDAFDSRRRFKLDIGPLVSISSVKYYDTLGTLTTISSSDYWADTNSYRPLITFKPTWSVPTLEDGRPSGIEVRFVAGYASADVVPKRAKQAIKLLAKYWWCKQEAGTVDDNAEPNGVGGKFGEIPFGVFSICHQLNASGYV